MKDINLALREKKPSAQLVKSTRIVYKFFYVALSVLIIGGLVVLAVFFLYDKRLKDITEQEERLRISITALEKTEQKYVLIKDRLGKINSILTADYMLDKINILQENMSLVQDPTRIVNAELNEDKSLIVVNTDSSLSMTKYLSSIISSGKYKRVIMNKFSYSPKSGYQMDMMFSR